MSELIYRRPLILKQIQRGRHAVIEASAGTGKTFTIEHLVVDLILSGDCAIDQVLIVTFTEKATAELRARIRKALEKIRFGAPDPEPVGESETIRIDESGRNQLDEAFRAFDRAPIFTIHGFCNRVLTDFAFHSGTLLNLELTDGRGAFHQAFRAELREHLAVDAGTRALLEKRLEEGTPDKLEALLFEAYRRRYHTSADCGARVQAARNLIELYDATVLKRIYRSVGLSDKTCNQVLKSLQDLGDYIRAAGGDGEVLLDSLPEAFSFDILIRPILPPPEGRLKTGYQPSPQAQEFARNLAMVQVGVSSREWKPVDLFLPRIAQRLDRYKREQGLIDYDDMLAWVWRALDGPGGPALAKALRERFRCALVDEFQDTDDLQWRIFHRVFIEGEGGNRLYVVGDPKQAIYAFRGADVFTYLKARGELTANGAAPVQLLDNFRSTSDLIAACNHIFDQTASPPLFKGEIRYQHPVRCGRPERQAVDARRKRVTPVILMRYRRTDRGKASAPEARAAIGRHIAAELHRLLFVDAGKVTIADKDGAARQVRPKDVFVLTRTRQESVEVGGYLREAGVPFAFYKQEGLFQTPEAHYVLDILRAVDQPHIRSNRLRAWLSPFFGVPLRELAVIEEVPPTHPLNERLYEWKAIAERGQLAELFDRLLHNSGLAYRELFLSASERELTNYLHIFETMLAQALTSRLALPEIIALLEDYVCQRASPAAENGNIQRLESERDAVSVMTVHMSKGLEADVVALFGGMGKLQDRRDLVVYHDKSGERRFAIGKFAKKSAIVKEPLSREEDDEDRRLLYVALTRARARLYLAMLPEGSTKVTPNGYYADLNERLLQIAGDLGGHGKWSKLFAVQNVAEPFDHASDAAEIDRQLETWTPPPELIDDRSDIEAESHFRNLRRLHAPLTMGSYTSLRGLEETGRWDIPAEEFKSDLETPVEDQDLPGGREVGIFLHEVIERLPMESFTESRDLEAWRKREDVRRLFRAAMHRHRVKEPWFERGTRAVFTALTSRIVIAPGREIAPLCGRHNVREMEFVYPIPESSHPLLSAAANGLWTVERGYLKGFVDFVFEHDGLVYFADWKSDRLSSYEPAAIERHVGLHYLLQAKIYSIGVIRLLQIRNQDDYERRFGGLLYLFLRGMDDSGKRGVHFVRPSWPEICAYEMELMEMAARPPVSHG
jgi:exodeoxyribonuclease V beta subunit